MKEFLKKPRSIIGSTLWGAIVAMVTFVAILVGDLLFSIAIESFGPARQIDSIAVGAGYSISLDAKPIHPFLAEYDQSIRVYGGDYRGGEDLGSIEIPTNTGGRVRIGVLASKNNENKTVILIDRKNTSLLNLVDLTSESIENWPEDDYVPIGLISGESYPVKIFPCSTLRILDEPELESVFSEFGTEYDGFCGT